MTAAAVIAQDWMGDAACRNADPDLFIGPEGEKPATQEMRENAARMICARCPVTGPCADWAFRTGDHFSISGGMTPEERANDRRSSARIQHAARLRAAIAAAGEKPCTGPCGETKPLDDFSLSKEGWRGDCKKCRNEKLRKQREERKVAA